MKFAFNQISSRRTPLMGLAALLIYFAHAYSFVELPSPLSTLFSFGNIGVDIFLLVGGFGIYYSLVNTASKSSFYWKRLIKVGLPFLLISIPYFFIFDFFVQPTERGDVIRFLLDISSLSFWQYHTGAWYVSMLVPLYLFAPFYVSLFRRTDSKRGLTFIAIILTYGLSLIVALANEQPILCNLSYV